MYFVLIISYQTFCELRLLPITMDDILTTNPITLTVGAVRQIKQSLATEGIPTDHGLRVGVKGGGCSGFSYELGFGAHQEGDQVFEQDGVRIFMKKAHGIYLTGIEIDWQEGLNNRGFTFANPNAKETCGCGTSFSA